ncbi:endolysin [Cyanobium sp. WAJ14-Wanaka]|uniref:endolysin n=1 Tax=Cyanobium sp. WAJ14-Wanaka TaxID=2823725 RepID=UPI0037C01C25
MPKLRTSCLLLSALVASAFTVPLASASEASVPETSASQPEEAGERLVFRLPPPAPRLFAITPERRALLNTIRYAEGTWAGGTAVGYRVMFGGGLMPSLDRHPDRVIRKSGYASAAAGAYQFMPFTWSLASRSLGLTAFGPEVQDQAAIFLIQRRGALALADLGLFTPHLAARLAPEWASFPTMAGRSFYGQPVRRFHDLRRFYEDNLSQLRGEVAQVAVEPSCLPAESIECRLEALKRLP